MIEGLTDPTLDGLLEAVQSANLDRHLDWCANTRRDTGGPGEKKMLRYIANTLEQNKIPVTIHEFDAFLSSPRRALLEVTAPERTTIRCSTHSFATSTGPNGLSASLSYLPDNDTKLEGNVPVRVLAHEAPSANQPF